MQRWLGRVLLIAGCILPFLRLGIGEIQPWDESLYVVRAKACLTFGAWLDQTQYAIGHLYSATHPPLGVWLIAISQELFGPSPFALRLPAALTAAAAVLLLWHLVRMFASWHAAIVAALSLATADVFLYFSHFAQMETSLLFFAMASIEALVYAIKCERFIWCLVSAVFLACGLLTKFAEVLFIVPILLLLPWAFHKQNLFRFPIISLAVALVLTAPWFLMMTARHPDYWSHVLGSLTTLSEGKYDPSALAWWYYVNRLIVGLPLIVLIPFVRRPSRFYFASLAWLIAMLIVLQIIDTRKAHFAFLMLAPGAMLIGAAWDTILALPQKWRATLFAVTLCAMAWSMSEQLRLFVTHRVNWSQVVFFPQAIVCAMLGFALAILLWKKVKSPARFALAFSVLLLGLALGHVLSEHDSVYEDGAGQVAAIAAIQPGKPNLIVVHHNFPHEQYAPQLAYYTNGWTLGWLPGNTSQFLTWDSAAKSTYTPDTGRDVAIVIHFWDRFNLHPAPDEPSLDSVERKFQTDFRHHQAFRSYTIYY